MIQVASDTILLALERVLITPDTVLLELELVLVVPDASSSPLEYDPDRPRCRPDKAGAYLDWLRCQPDGV